MTDEELKALVAENSRAIRVMHEDSERVWQEFREEMRALREESKQHSEESERIWQEVLASRRDSDRLFESIHRDLGHLGNKQGDYTEALFRPSLERALREQFGMTVIQDPQRIRDHGEEIQLDMIGHARDEIPEVYVVEIKTQLRSDAFDQLLAHLRKLPRFLPEHRGKKLFGILAALDVPQDLRDRAAKEGLYLATIKDDVFEIAPPDGFEPQAFGLRSLS